MKKSAHRHRDRRHRHAARLSEIAHLFRKAALHQMLNDQSEQLRQAAIAMSAAANAYRASHCSRDGAAYPCAASQRASR